MFDFSRKKQFYPTKEKFIWKQENSIVAFFWKTKWGFTNQRDYSLKFYLQSWKRKGGNVILLTRQKLYPGKHVLTRSVNSPETLPSTRWNLPPLSASNIAGAWVKAWTSCRAKGGKKMHGSQWDPGEMPADTCMPQLSLPKTLLCPRTRFRLFSVPLETRLRLK